VFFVQELFAAGEREFVYTGGRLFSVVVHLGANPTAFLQPVQGGIEPCSASGFAIDILVSNLSI